MNTASGQTEHVSPSLAQRRKAERFSQLHREGIFIAPNPWDIGSAQMLESMGFQALATTSSGVALTLGRRDGQIGRDEIIAHCAQICAAVSIPVTADLENGFGDAPEQVAQTIRLAAQAGLSGGSIEDYSGNPAAPLYAFNHAVERVAAAVEAVAGLDLPFVLTARAEQMLRSEKDLDASIDRLLAFEKLGAQVLYAPGLRDLDQVSRIMAEVSLPVNVLIAGVRGADVPSLKALGVRRISTGGALSRACVAPLIAAGREMLDQGSFGWLSQATSPVAVDELLSAPAR